MLHTSLCFPVTAQPSELVKTCCARVYICVCCFCYIFVYVEESRRKKIWQCILLSVVWQPSTWGTCHTCNSRVDFCIFLIAPALVSSELAHKSAVMDWLLARHTHSLTLWCTNLPKFSMCATESVSIWNFCSIRFIWLTVLGIPNNEQQGLISARLYFLFAFSLSLSWLYYHGFSLFCGLTQSPQAQLGVYMVNVQYKYICKTLSFMDWRTYHYEPFNWK